MKFELTSDKKVIIEINEENGARQPFIVDMLDKAKAQQLRMLEDIEKKAVSDKARVQEQVDKIQARIDAVASLSK